MNAAAEEAGCLVAYPAQPAAANGKRCWNWFRPEDQRRDAGEPALIAGIVRAMMAAQAVDPDAGLCGGAVGGRRGGGGARRGLSRALRRGRRAFRAAGGRGARPALGAGGDARRARAARAAAPARCRPSSSTATRTCWSTRRTATAVAAQATAGGPARRVERERGAAGGLAYSRTLHADAAGRTVCEHWTVHGGGHAWAGGSAGGQPHRPARPGRDAGDAALLPRAAPRRGLSSRPARRRRRGWPRTGAASSRATTPSPSRGPGSPRPRRPSRTTRAPSRSPPSTPAGLPNVRMVLLKAIEADAFVFYTNYESVKAGEIDARRQGRLRHALEEPAPPDPGARHRDARGRAAGGRLLPLAQPAEPARRLGLARSRGRSRAARR